MFTTNLDEIYALPYIGMGLFGYVFKLSDDRVIKVPRIFPESEHEHNSHLNWVNLESLKKEGAIYKRLGVHEGIIQCLKIQDESIELAFANEGTLLTYIQTHSPPTKDFRFEWIRSLTDTFVYVHSRRVLVQDIDLQNILVHDSSLKLVDFGQSFILPPNADMKHACVNETTTSMEILHLGCIFYSIAAWTKFKYYYFDHWRWPLLEELPDTNDIICGDVIKKCWTAKYATIEEVAKDIQSQADEVSNH
ncbi:kinase-like domain-containing protein [Talaromyces proteolyticus]|uniref:Kinase-like domain-containing protein n=1 Tax=Talaromyces proteolyticus TaxID=1131652 RepID=A0AAD4KSG1_9EURO|nr:kinase-like domain-containing protein [Talaromyces proteolyticus]KAH8698348.1 kinase-like domain-containing protein [Talaromyces proteolyticus]